MRFKGVTLICSIGLAATIFFVYLFFGVLLPDFLPGWANTVIFTLCVILGMFLGFFAGASYNLGMFIVGAWAGATLGFMIFDAVFV